MIARKPLTRRGFLKITAGTGAGLVLGCYARPLTKREEISGADLAPGAWLRVDGDGIATVTISKSDMGQGSRTALATIVADELGIAWENVRVEQADANPEKYGSQGTGGSGSVRGRFMPLRYAGATARMMLVAAAAQKWGVSPDACRVEMGKVVQVGGPGAELGFGELASAAAALPVPERSAVKLKDPKDFVYIGKPVKRVDAPAIVMGKATYGLDVHVEGLKIASIERPPAFGARLKSFEDRAAKKVPGVLAVLETPAGLTVIADHTWSALAGRDRLQVEWDMGPNADLDSAKILAMLKAEVKPFPEMAAAKTIEVAYDLPFLAHAPMEPMNCIAHVHDGRCEVWAPTQSADGARGAVARALGMQPDDVLLHVPLIGGGFGRRLNADYAVEAALISKAFGGPIQVVWTRTDDMRNDYYRPTSHHAMKGGVDASGMPVAWAHQMIGPGGGAGEMRATRLQYGIEGALMGQGGASIPVPTGAWRSVGSSQLGFVNECFFDELARLGGQDPLELRLKTVQNPRLKKCLETVRDRSDWGKPMPKGQGRGVACFDGFGSLVAHVVEVTVKGGVVKVNRVVAAVDCGVVVSPSGVMAQIEGTVVDGISTALHAGITIAGGGVEQKNFYDYPWIRMAEMPHVEVHLVPSGDSPGGMGEPGYPSVPPAVMNAVFAATGKRIRRLPMREGDLA